MKHRVTCRITLTCQRTRASRQRKPNMECTEIIFSLLGRGSFHLPTAERHGNSFHWAWILAGYLKHRELIKCTGLFLPPADRKWERLGMLPYKKVAGRSTWFMLGDRKWQYKCEHTRSTIQETVCVSSLRPSSHFFSSFLLLNKNPFFSFFSVFSRAVFRERR